MIYHIYWGTAGNAGLYTDEIYKTLDRLGYEQKVFVSYYYPFDYGVKVFFKRTEMEHCHYNGIARKVMQGFELLYALLIIIVSSKKDKPKVINYSYVSSGNILILYGLKLIKRISECKLVITCHDVVPFSHDEKGYKSELTIKRKIYSLADYYLIHNESSRIDLQRLFNVNCNQILIHPFPLMDLSKLDKETVDNIILYDFLFIGQMRMEKGVSLLIDAWKALIRYYPNARLCIAGNPLYYIDYLNEQREWCKQNGVILKLGYVADSDYAKIVRSARCVVFPYTAGTNSGVISTAVSLNRDVITSDIGMFSENPFIPKDNMFKSGDYNALCEKLVAYMNGELVSHCVARIEQYREVFEQRVKEVYAVLS